MRRSILLPALLTASLLLPLVAAAENTTDINVNLPGNGNSGGSNSGSPQQSTGFAGLSTTAIIVLVVLAVLVIALIVALAGRNDYP